MTPQRQRALNRLKTYTQEDAQLSGMPDPLNDTHDITDDALKLFEEDFYKHLARDHEYWEHRLIQPPAPAPVDEPPPAQGLSQPPKPLFTWLHGALHRWPIADAILSIFLEGDNANTNRDPQGPSAG